jgi:hypothetical protein
MRDEKHAIDDIKNGYQVEGYCGCYRCTDESEADWFRAPYWLEGHRWDQGQGTREKQRTKDVIEQAIYGCRNEDDPCWDGKQTYLERRKRMNEIFSMRPVGLCTLRLEITPVHPVLISRILTPCEDTYRLMQLKAYAVGTSNETILP